MARVAGEGESVRRKTGRPRGSVDRRGAARRVSPSVLSFVVRSFGEQIRRVRENANVSADELAVAIGVDPETVMRWESTRRVPRLRNLVAIAIALRVPVDHLVPSV